jgi:hypothetical protein
MTAIPGELSGGFLGLIPPRWSMTAVNIEMYYNSGGEKL